MNKNLEFPERAGWYWILIESYDFPIPCWFSPNNDPPDKEYFLPAGLGDSSSNGIYEDEITKIGPEIIAPNL